MEINKAHKILIVRFSSIGDIVLTTPIVRCLKQQTGAIIHYLTKKSYAPILESNPYIDKVYAFSKDLEEIVSDLQAENYTCIVDLHKNLRSFQLKRLLKIPRYSFDKINIQKWLLVNFKINRLPDVHIVDRYFEAVAFANVKNDGQGLDYFIPDAIKVEKHSFLQKEYIVFAIGAAHATKRLPLDKIVAIVEQIDLPVLLIGGPSEQAIGNAIEQQSSKQIYNQCGQVSLHQSAHYIEQAAAVLTHDTGMMHIAAAFQQKIVSIWGNTIPEFGMYPYYKNGVHNNISVQVNDLPCRPCSKIGHEQCPKGHFKCMNQLNTSSVIAALNELLGDN